VRCPVCGDGGHGSILENRCNAGKKVWNVFTAQSVMYPFETIIGIVHSVELLSTTQEWSNWSY